MIPCYGRCYTTPPFPRGSYTFGSFIPHDQGLVLRYGKRSAQFSLNQSSLSCTFAVPVYLAPPLILRVTAFLIRSDDIVAVQVVTCPPLKSCVDFVLAAIADITGHHSHPPPVDRKDLRPLCRASGWYRPYRSRCADYLTSWRWSHRERIRRLPNQSFLQFPRQFLAPALRPVQYSLASLL